MKTLRYPTLLLVCLLTAVLPAHGYYGPSIGRFINRDPIEEKGGLHLYAYVGNNSVNHWDYLGNVVGRQKSELEAEGWVVYGPGTQGTFSEDGQSVTFATMHNSETGETRYRTVPVAKDSFFDHIINIGFGIIASVLTYGAASPGAIAWTGSTVAGGALAGAAAGTASQIASTQSFNHLGQAALSGAIGGAVVGGYGKSWTLDRVAVSTVASGVSSEISGGDFRDGAILGGAIAVGTYLNVQMHNYEFNTSPAVNQARPLPASLEGAFDGSVAGTRIYANGNLDPGILGGVQGAPQVMFNGHIVPIDSAINHIMEVAGGPHDFFSHPFAYDSLGRNNAAQSFFGRATAGVAGASAANAVANGVSVVALVPTIPLTATALVGLSPTVTIAVSQNLSRKWPPPND